MKKTFKINDFKTNEIIKTTDKIKGGAATGGGITVIIVDKTSGGIIGDNIYGRTAVIEDNVMV